VYLIFEQVPLQQRTVSSGRSANEYV